MAKRPRRLTDGFIERASVGVHGDGRGGYGLAIRVHRATSGHVTRSWIQRLRIGGRPTNIGLGRWPLVSLAEARAKAISAAIAVQRGEDPRRRRREPAPSAPKPGRAAPPVTFGDVFQGMIALNRGSLRPSTISVYERSVRHLSGGFVGKPVAAITSGDVLAELKPIWNEKPGAARLVLASLGKTFNHAIGSGVRPDSPVANARRALPRHRRPAHQKAVPVAEAPDALRRIRDAATTDAQRRDAAACGLIVLTATRATETTGARWSEFDLDSGVWTIPSSRMKTRREHRVPLSRGARAVLDQVGGSRRGFVFPGAKGSPMDRSRPRLAQKRAGINATVHGWRSTFRRWCAEEGVSREVAEMALAHALGGTEGAYQRSDLLEQRRPVMERWGRFVAVVDGAL